MRYRETGYSQGPTDLTTRRDAHQRNVHNVVQLEKKKVKGEYLLSQHKHKATLTAIRPGKLCGTSACMNVADARL